MPFSLAIMQKSNELNLPVFQVYENGKKLAELKGNYSFLSILSETANMRVRFHSDGSKQMKGFVASFRGKNQLTVLINKN